MRREGMFKDAVKRTAKAEGWWIIKIHGGRFNAGMPDLFMTHPGIGGRLVAVELKASPDPLPAVLEDMTLRMPTALQMKNLRECAAAGGRSFVVCRHSDGISAAGVGPDGRGTSVARLPGNGKAISTLLNFVFSEAK